jgi:hypothetical protein
MGYAPLEAGLRRLVDVVNRDYNAATLPLWLGLEAMKAACSDKEGAKNASQNWNRARPQLYAHRGRGTGLELSRPFLGEF